VIQQKVKERDDAVARGENVGDRRPGWRILRAEIWRQFGTLLDLEKPYEEDEAELIAFCTAGIVASQIQQRERLYDLAYQRMSAVIDEVLDPEKVEDEWDWDQLEDALAEQFNMKIEVEPGTPDEASEQIWPKIEEKLKAREEDLSRPWLLYFQRHFSLEEIDQQWIEHLKTMDALREGIGLMGYGQKDPKKEYKKAGFSMFKEMMHRIQEHTIQKVFRVQIQKQEEAKAIPAVKEQDLGELQEKGVADKNEDEAEIAAQAARGAHGKARTAGDGAVTAPVKRERPKVGRNDPCPCGSGKKYKKCHGKDEEGQDAA
jgi:preprotein translocase subunit SecA